MNDELTHLLLVVEHGSFTEAARRAHLSQPALSASIQRLEAWAGGPLLHRLPRGARLTAAGEALVPHARASLAALDAGRRAAAEVWGLARGRVVVGGGATACSHLLPPLLMRFRALHPGVELQLRESFTPLIPEAVRAGALDLGVVEGEGEPWAEDELVLVVAPGAPVDAPFVSFTREAALRRHLERVFPGARVAVELHSLASVLGLVRAGMGPALLPRLACASDLALGQLVCVEHPGLPVRRRLGLLHAGEDRLSPAARALRALLLDPGDGVAQVGAAGSPSGWPPG